MKKAVVSVEEPERLKLGEETVKRTMAVKEMQVKKGKELSVKLEF